MANPMSYNVFVGAETGLLKGINTSAKSWDNLTSLDSVDRSREIKSMCWKTSEENQIYMGLKKGKVLVYDISQNGIFDEINLSIDSIKSNLVSLTVHENKLISGVDNGIVDLWDDNNECLTSINSGDNLHCLAHKECLIATGGKETELKLWDLNKTKVPVFKAKNVKNDWLNLRVPVWVTGIQLTKSDKVITCTGHHQIRLYDPQSPKRRPVLDMDFEEFPLTAISMRPSHDNQVVVGNTQGNMALIDLRKGQMVQCFKGFAGSIRDIKCHPEQPLVASCGMDRFLYIHDIDSKKLLHKFYLKSRLNCLLLYRNWYLEEKEEKHSNSEKESSSDDLEDDIWQNMEVVKTKTIKKSEKKRIHSDHDEIENKRKKVENSKKVSNSVSKNKKKLK